jgi:cytochrome c biogenesis protein CcmG/thiol:disulfide interchange protein DsbE
MNGTSMTRRVRAAVGRYPGLVLVATPCLVAALIVSLVWSPGGTSGDAPGAAPIDATTVAQDRPAPDFDLPMLAGSRRLRLSSLRGEVVVVNFWASWCDVCQQDVLALRQLVSAQRSGAVAFVGVDHGDVSSAARTFLAHNDLHYPNVIDRVDLLRKFGGIGLPMTYVVDRSGRIRYQVTGSIDADHLRQAIERVSAIRSS